MATRYDVGVMILKTIDKDFLDKITDDLGELAPDFIDYLVENFGDNYSRPYLSLKERNFVAIASLISLGHFDYLENNVLGALNLGASINEIIEVIMQTSHYAGFPASLKALLALKKIIKNKSDQVKLVK